MLKHEKFSKDEEREEERESEISHVHVHGNKVVCKGAPETIKSLLKLLIEDEVVIILQSGEQETVEVEAVVGNLLVASVDCGKIKFIDISCICAVIVKCGDVIEAFLGYSCRGDRFRDDD